MKNNMNRRGFFKTVASVVGLSVVAPTILNTIFGSTGLAQERRRRGEADKAAGGGMPMVDPKDPVAKAVKYIEDHKKNPDSKGNTCATCSFYKKTDVKNGKEVGTCTIFAGKLVVGEGWCASWNKKA